MLGIALGSFTQGFSQGVNLRTQMDEVARQRDLRKSVQGITKTGKAAYDADVAAGKAEPGDFMSRYTNELVPQIAEKYLEAGEPDKAAAWTDWATSTAAKKATKEFNQGLQQFQMGDVEAGLKSMQKAANTNGYGPDGKTSVAEIYDEDAGAVTGYRLTYTLPDGKQHTKNVATTDLPNFFAATINPQSAFELQQASAAAQSKADLEVETYTRKKKAEKELGVGAGAMTQAQYQNAIQDERKRIEDASLLSGEELTDDEKEAQAKELVDKRLGLTGAAPAEPQVAVDPKTGEQVQLPTTPTQDATSQVQPQAPTEAAPVDTGASPTDTDLGVPADTSVEEQTSGTAPGVVAPSPQAATTQVQPSNQEAQIARADQLVKQGADAQQVAQALVSAGIPVQSWPQSVQLAARHAQIGIGR